MKRVIDGMVFNTETATEICRLPCQYHRSDFQWHRTHLYRSPKGRYFIAGEGGPRSMWREPCGSNGWSDGDGIRVLDTNEAREWAERCELSPEDMLAAGFEIPEG